MKNKNCTRSLQEGECQFLTGSEFLDRKRSGSVWELFRSPLRHFLFFLEVRNSLRTSQDLVKKLSTAAGFLICSHRVQRRLILLRSFQEAGALIPKRFFTTSLHDHKPGHTQALVKTSAAVA